jgi:PAS domain S-box-containing protein
MARLEAYFGYSRKDIEGKKCWIEFIDPKDLDKMKEYHRLRRIDPDNVPDKYEFKLINAKGDSRDIHISVSIIPDTKKSIVSMTDVTDLKKTEIT